jgi:hypothetical protein
VVVVRVLSQLPPSAVIVDHAPERTTIVVHPVPDPAVLGFALDYQLNVEQRAAARHQLAAYGVPLGARAEL